MMTVELILEKIKDARKQKRYTQREMADKLKITQTQYSNYESGKSEMSLNKFLKIVDILEVDLFNARMHHITGDDLDKLKEAIDNIRGKFV